MKKENRNAHNMMPEPIYSDIVAIAREIARTAHQGQFDKANQPYIRHPEAVSRIAVENLRGRPAVSDTFRQQVKIVSLLHDVIEDTSVTIDDLRECKIPEACLKAVSLLTKEKDQDYWEYLTAIKQNELARAVKIADMTHNSDLSRLSTISEADLVRRDKYRKEIDYLTAE